MNNNKIDIWVFIEYVKNSPLKFMRYVEIMLDLDGNVYFANPCRVEKMIDLTGYKVRKTEDDIYVYKDNDVLATPTYELPTKYGYCVVHYNNIIIPRDGVTANQLRSIYLLHKYNVINKNFNSLNGLDRTNKCIYVTSHSFHRLTETDRKLLYQLIHIILFKKNISVGLYKHHKIAIMGIKSSSQLISYCQGEIDEFNPTYMTLSNDSTDRTHDTIIEVVGFDRFDDLIYELIININHILRTEISPIVCKYITKDVTFIDTNLNTKSLISREVETRFTTITVY